MLAFIAVLIATVQQPLPPDSIVRAILTERVPALHGAGIVVGLFGPDDERRVVAVGVAGDRVFELGSLTAIFNGAVLADMAAGGAVRLDEMPSADEDSSGGIAPLGRALVLRAGKKYEDLVRQRVLWPLGMRETLIALVPDLRSRLAPGHDANGLLAPKRPFSTLTDTAEFRSTMKDMLTFVMANVDSATTPVGRALHQRLGWRTRGSIVWRSGGSDGYHAYIGFDPARGVGVVLLSNSSVGTDDIGFRLLDEKMQ